MVANDRAPDFDAHEERIVDALTAFRHEATAASRLGVRAAIETYVDALREAEALPEHVVIMTKAAIRRAGFVDSPDISLRLTLHQHGLMAGEFITCAIARFFQSTAPSAVLVDVADRGMHAEGLGVRD